MVRGCTIVKIKKSRFQLGVKVGFLMVKTATLRQDSGKVGGKIAMGGSIVARKLKQIGTLVISCD